MEICRGMYQQPHQSLLIGLMGLMMILMDTCHRFSPHLVVNSPLSHPLQRWHTSQMVFRHPSEGLGTVANSEQPYNWGLVIVSHNELGSQLIKLWNQNMKFPIYKLWNTLYIMKSNYDVLANNFMKSPHNRLWNQIMNHLTSYEIKLWYPCL